MMEPNGAPASPDPGRIVAAMTAFEQTAALVAAIQIGLFTAIAEGDVTVEALARRCNCAERGVRILADTLSVHALLSKSDGRYALAPDTAAYLDARAPGYLGEASRFLASPERIRLCLADPAGWARRGGPADAGNTSEDSPAWVDFARSMTNFMAPVARSTASSLRARGLPVKRALDVAAGHGLFGIELAKVFPDARVTVLDWPSVAPLAMQNAIEAGVGDRFDCIAGSAFDVELGADYDLVLVPNFLHHFDRDAIVAFLVRVRVALGEAGSAAIVEYTPDANRTSPAAAALFAFSMLTATPAGDAYTAEALQSMCLDAGLPNVEVTPLEGTPETLLLASRGGAS